MKKWIAIVLSLMMMCSLAACGNSGDSGEAEKEDVVKTENEGTDASDSGEESDKAYVQEKGTLVVGITDFEPMDYKDESGEWMWKGSSWRSTGIIRLWNWTVSPLIVYGTE